jgi:hypothetical protein
MLSRLRLELARRKRLALVVLWSVFLNELQRLFICSVYICIPRACNFYTWESILPKIFEIFYGFEVKSYLMSLKTNQSFAGLTIFLRVGAFLLGFFV